MTATLEINYEDGTKESIVLDRAIELNISEDRPKSLCFNQLTNGKWVMTVTKHLFNGKKFDNVQCSKNRQESIAE